MKHLKYLSTLVFAAILAFTACNSDDYTEDPAFEEEIKTELVDKSQLPQWLADYITYLEYVPEGQEIPNAPSGFYRFEWKGRTYYEYYSTSQSMMHTEMYTSDGERWNLKECDYRSFSDGVRNWTIVYLLHPSHEKPANIIYPPACPDSLQSFFKTAFTYNQIEWKGMDYQYQILFKDSADCYIINTPHQLKDIYVGNNPLPNIDFDKYSLILGKVSTYSHYSMRRQQLREAHDNMDRPVLQLFYEHLEDAGAVNKNIMTIQYFWGLYPKMDDENLNVSLMLDNQLNRTFSWETSRVPRVKHYYPFYWDSESHQLSPISETDFNTLALGYGWRETEEYEISDEGLISHFEDIGGIDTSSYLFFEGSVFTFRYDDAISAYTSRKQSMCYVEDKNMVYVNSSPKYQLLSIEEQKIEAVKKVYRIGGKYGEGRDVFEYAVFHRLTNEDFRKIQEVVYPNGIMRPDQPTIKQNIGDWIITTLENGIVMHASFGIYPDIINAPASPEEFFNNYLPITDDNKLVLTKTGEFCGWPEKEYQQYYKGVLVSGGFYNCQFLEDEKTLYHIHGYFIPITDFDVAPDISENDARQIALVYVGFGESSVYDVRVKLLVREFYKDGQGHLHLAYHVRYVPKGWYNSYELFIDAHSGRILAYNMGIA